MTQKSLEIQESSPESLGALRQTFLSKLCLTAAAIDIILVTLGIGKTPWITTAIGILGFFAFLILWWLSKKGFRRIDAVLIAIAWVFLFLFDAGTSQQDASWIMHIPITLLAWILFPKKALRILWILIPIFSVFLVNQGFSPRLVSLIPAMAEPASIPIYLVAALISSVLCLTYLQEMYTKSLDALEAARKKAERASRAKSEFLSHMSHEFRTPLNAVSGFADLLQGSADTSEASENLRAIKSSADHLVHLINDVLDLSRLESGRLTLANNPFGPTACLEEVRSTLFSLAHEKGLEIYLETSTSLPRVFGDRMRWKQVLLNLVGNAVKFTPSGSIRIQATWTSISAENGQLSVSVTDSGPGIPPDALDKIFDRFERLNSHTEANTTGTGLGLAISRSLAEAMSGNLKVTSTLGCGSTFTFTVPFLIAPKDAAQETSLALARPVLLTGSHILLAEDNRINVRLATQVLQKLGATWDVAEDGGKAVELLRQRSYDLVLLDLHMPVMDGFDVIRVIRDPNGGTQNPKVPVLALTADAFEETRLRTLEAGMDDFLPKPFRLVDLADRASRLIQRGMRRPRV